MQFQLPLRVCISCLCIYGVSTFAPFPVGGNLPSIIPRSNPFSSSSSSATDRTLQQPSVARGNPWTDWNLGQSSVARAFPWTDWNLGQPSVARAFPWTDRTLQQPSVARASPWTDWNLEQPSVARASPWTDGSVQQPSSDWPFRFTDRPLRQPSSPWSLPRTESSFWQPPSGRSFLSTGWGTCAIVLDDANATCHAIHGPRQHRIRRKVCNFCHCLEEECGFNRGEKCFQFEECKQRPGQRNSPCNGIDTPSHGLDPFSQLICDFCDKYTKGPRCSGFCEYSFLYRCGL